MSTTTPATPYGFELERGEWFPQRDCIGSVEKTLAGNYALRIGRELEQGGGWQGGGWTQTAYVVLTPAEAASLSRELDPTA